MVIPASCIGSDRPGTSTDHPPQAARTGRIFDIKRFSSHDGPGIRSTVFLTGCPLRCAWCHNPEAFAAQDETGGNVRDVTVPDLIRELERDIPYYDASGGGVTISGGEPLFQSRFVFDLLRACRKRELHTALDTCGLVDSALLTEASSLTDIILYDLKAMDSAVHGDWTGAPNSKILENLRLLGNLDVNVWIRLPLIPGVNDDTRNVDAMIDFLSGTRFRRISILPYHRIADAKYQRLGLPNRMTGVEPPSPGRIEEIRARFAAAGFDPHVGS
jgi:pyruvate formate lyase activating enzyme